MSSGAALARKIQNQLDGARSKPDTSAGKVSVVYGRGRGGGRLRLLARGEGEAHNEGTWIFSYADMITILMMFFILLLSISNVSPEKFEELKQAVKSTGGRPAAGSEGAAVEGAFQGSRKVGSVSVDFLLDRAMNAGNDRNAQMIAAAQALLDQVDGGAVKRNDSLRTQFDSLQGRLKGLESFVEVKQLEQAKPREMSFVTNSDALFEPMAWAQTRPVLSAAGLRLARELAASAAEMRDSIRLTVEAHTSELKDSAGIGYGKGRVAWTRSDADGNRELTVRQASALAKALEQAGLARNPIGIVGFGHARPVATETRANAPDPDAIQANRRIVIRLQQRPKSGPASEGESQ